MGAESNNFRTASNPKTVGLRTEPVASQRKPNGPQSKEGLAIGLRNHVIAAIAGIVFGYFVLLCLGPQYDFLNLSHSLQVTPQEADSGRPRKSKTTNLPNQARTKSTASPPATQLAQQSRPKEPAPKRSNQSNNSPPANMKTRVAPSTTPTHPPPMSASPSDIDQTKPIVEMPSIEPKPVVVETAPMQIDDLNSSETRLQLASQNAQSSEDFRKVAEESLALSSDSLKFQNRTAAIRLSLLAEQAAQSSKDVALIRSTTANITKYVVATKTINVTANRNWQAAADVRKGDVVAMTATGTWHTWPDGGENWKSDANGTKFNAGKTFPLPGAKQGALLGKIGSTPFVVGRSAVIEVQNSGRLEMINNDDVRRSDNRGAISVEIRVLR